MIATPRTDCLALELSQLGSSDGETPFTEAMAHARRLECELALAHTRIDALRFATTNAKDFLRDYAMPSDGACARRNLASALASDDHSRKEAST